MDEEEEGQKVKARAGHVVVVAEESLVGTTTTISDLVIGWELK